MIGGTQLTNIDTDNGTAVVAFGLMRSIGVKDMELKRLVLE